MIYINNKEKIEKLKEIIDFALITDFDWTLTTDLSQTSMGIVPDYIGGELLEKRKEIFEHYHPYELDYNMDKYKKLALMREWAQKSFSMLSKYITEDIVINATNNAKTYLRSGVKELFKTLYERDIPIIVMSAGFGNVIKLFLEKEGILYDNVTIVANFFEFNNNKAELDIHDIIFTSNKDYYNIPEITRKPIEQKDKILLFGDVIEDLKIINKEQLRKNYNIWFFR